MKDLKIPQWPIEKANQKERWEPTMQLKWEIIHGEKVLMQLHISNHGNELWSNVPE